MEDSMNKIEAHQSFLSPPRRRRSTFFERRNSMVPSKPSENNDPNISKTTTETNSKHQQDLRRYYENLLAEKEQWKKEAADRKNKHNDLEKQWKNTRKTSHLSRISYSALSDEDIAYLNAKPNTSKLIESQQALHKSVQKAQAIFRRASELDNIILSYCESRVNEITEYILNNSTIEPKE